MSKYSTSRMFFESGVQTLVTLLFTIPVVVGLQLLYTKLGNPFATKQSTADFGIILGLAFTAITFISLKAIRVMDNLHKKSDVKAAIIALEKHGLKVGINLADLPHPKTTTEFKECAEACAALMHHNIPYLLINRDNQVFSKIVIIGEAGMHDKNVYKQNLEKLP